MPAVEGRLRQPWLLDYLDGSRVCEFPELPRPDAIIASLTMTGRPST